MRDLQAKVDLLENDLKKKEDELEAVQDRERDSATRINVDKKSWDDARLDLENQLADAQDLNDRLKQELDRIRDDHAADARQMREEIDALRQNGTRGGSGGGGAGDAELQRENDDLRRLLREQEQVTEEVQQEAQNLLREMRTLSQQSGAAWEKQTEMERTIEKLEAEAQEWRSRYTKTKTQLRNLKATSMSLTVDDAAKYMRERGFTTENGLVKDFHVTKFQVAIDDLLQRARSDQPDKIMETMKTVVVSVRRIIKDMDDAGNGSEEQRKLKGRIASTANNLITAAKNFAASAGISPVSLIDAAASHLVAAIVELLKTVKIRPTPAGELEDEDDDDMMTPGNNSVGFFSPRSQAPTPLTTTKLPAEENLPPPPPFRGFGNRLSADSSAYSPVNSPRESTATDRFGSGGLGINGSNGNINGNMNGDSGKALPPPPSSNGYGANGYGGMAPQRDNAAEDLKVRYHFPATDGHHMQTDTDNRDYRSLSRTRPPTLWPTFKSSSLPSDPTPPSLPFATRSRALPNRLTRLWTRPHAAVVVRTHSPTSKTCKHVGNGSWRRANAGRSCPTVAWARLAGSGVCGHRPYRQSPLRSPESQRNWCNLLIGWSWVVLVVVMTFHNDL